MRLAIIILLAILLVYACVVIRDSTDINIGVGHERTGKGGIDVDVNKPDTVQIDSIR